MTGEEGNLSKVPTRYYIIRYDEKQLHILNSQQQ